MFVSPAEGGGGAAAALILRVAHDRVRNDQMKARMLAGVHELLQARYRVWQHLRAADATLTTASIFAAFDACVFADACGMLCAIMCVYVCTAFLFQYLFLMFYSFWKRYIMVGLFQKCGRPRSPQLKIGLHALATGLLLVAAAAGHDEHFTTRLTGQYHP